MDYFPSTTKNGMHNVSTSNRYIAIPPDIPNHPQHNFATMNMATNEISFITTSTAFATTLVTTNTLILDNPPIAIIPAAFQVTIHVAITMVALSSTLGPYTVPDGV